MAGKIEAQGEREGGAGMRVYPWHPVEKARSVCLRSAQLGVEPATCR